MTNKEYVAGLLIEAAELLSSEEYVSEIFDEAAARDQRKEVRRDAKSLKAEQRSKDFFSGKLSKEEGQKAYEELSGKLDKMMEIVQEIPKETVGEKFWAYFVRSGFTVEGFLKFSIISVVGSSLANAAALSGKAFLTILFNTATTAASIADFHYDQSKVGDTDEKNWNKAYALKTVNKVRTKVESAYRKYYKD